MNVFSLLPYRASVYLGIIALLAIFAGSAGWYHTVRLRLHVWHAESAIHALERERQQLISEIRRLSEHPMTREKIAREQLQLGRPDELIYCINR